MYILALSKLSYQFRNKCSCTYMASIAPCFYCIVLLHYSLYFYFITVRFIVLYYGTCIGLGYCVYLAIQLFSSKYVTIKLS